MKRFIKLILMKIHSVFIVSSQCLHSVFTPINVQRNITNTNEEFEYLLMIQKELTLTSLSTNYFATDNTVWCTHIFDALTLINMNILIIDMFSISKPNMFLQYLQRSETLNSQKCFLGKTCMVVFLVIAIIYTQYFFPRW